MFTIMLLMFLFALFGIGWFVLALARGLLSLSFKILTGGIVLLIILICGIPLLMAGLFFGGLAILF